MFRNAFHVTDRMVSVSTVFRSRIATVFVVLCHLVCMRAHLNVVAFGGRCPYVYVRVNKVIQLNFRYLMTRLFHLIRITTLRKGVVYMIVRNASI